MKTSDLIGSEFGNSLQLQEEFGPLPVEEHVCLLEAAEEWEVQLGDELARAVTELGLPTTSDLPEEADCTRFSRAIRGLDSRPPINIFMCRWIWRKRCLIAENYLSGGCRSGG